MLLSLAPGGVGSGLSPIFKRFGIKGDPFNSVFMEGMVGFPEGIVSARVGLDEVGIGGGDLTLSVSAFGRIQTDFLVTGLK